MPEAFTYYDMQRMIAAQVPVGTYRLELHEQWFRAKKSKVPTIRDEKGLLKDYTQASKEFFFQGSDVQFYGKALGIPLGDGVWLRVHFLLHGHGLPCSRKEYDTMVAAWTEEADKKKHTYVLAAIVGAEMCVILVDRNRLTTITPIHTMTGVWYDKTLAPCPIQKPDEFERNIQMHWKSLSKRTGAIYKEMSDSNKNNIWNGIGTSHAVEILHRAFIHPECYTQDVFNVPATRKKLFSAIRSFFLIAKSEEYCKRVPAGSTSERAFDFSESVTKYINSQFTKAYRKQSTLLSLSDYHQLQTAGLLAPDMEPLGDDWKENLDTETGRMKKKKVPIYTIELRSKKNGGLDPDQEGRAKYTYTCIFPQFGAKNGRILTEEEATKKRMFLNKDGNRAEIGIGSFMDTIKEIKLRKESTVASSHVVPIKTGKRGRPRSRKIINLEVKDSKRSKSM